MRHCILLFTFFLISLGLSAQEIIVQGKVSEISGNILPGVNIRVKNKSQGTITDFDGNYSIKVLKNDTLIFSFIGYNKEIVPVDGQKRIDVELFPDIESLKEVVVVGYGVTKKKDLTGSVSVINPDEITGMPAPRADLLLQGRSSGVEITRNSGAPGGATRVRIRGVNSINSNNDPLVVIDGFPGGNLDDINPNDIERIDVLKDASALAIYGARATNGVIIITTKSGKAGQSKIDFSYSHSYQEITKKIDVLGSQDYGYYINEAYKNDGDPRPYPVIGSRRFPTRPEDIDWQVDWHDLVYRPGKVDEYQINFSGGSEKMSYYISGNYFNQQGVIPNSDFTRYNARVNLDAQLKKWMKIGTNINASRKEFLGETGFWSGIGVSNSILTYSPLFEPIDSLGNWTYDKLTIPSDNPLAVAEIPVPVSELKTDYINPDFYAQFFILPSLTFKSSAGFETTVRRHGQANLQESIQGANKVSPSGNSGEAWFNNYQSFRFVNENVLTFDKDFNENHHLLALAGYSWENYQYEGYSARSYGFISDAFMFNYLNMGAGDVYSSIGSGKSTSQIESYFGRIHYDFKEKFSLTLNGRLDGASVFASNNKYGFFPSAALAWKIHNEPFLLNADFLSECKARISYGVVGNASIPSYASLSKFATTKGVINNNTQTIVVIPVSVSNNELTWESTKQFDVGIDVGLFDHRITFTADYYEKLTYDLLFEKLFPATSGFRKGYVNIGEVENKGYEFNIHSVNINQPFRWETDFNISSNKNKILKLTGDDEMQFVNNATLSTALSMDLNILKVGQPVSTFYGLVYEGVYDDPEEAEANNAQLGSAKYKDVDGNGVFEAANDRKIIGSAFPDFIWGMNNTFVYKGIELGIFVQASHGAEIYNLTRQRIETLNPENNASQYAFQNRTRQDFETGEWTFTDIPKISAYNKMLPTDRFIEDGSYIRLQNISLSYSLPHSFISKFKLTQLKVYLSGQNLYVWSKYKGYDPEVSRFKNDDMSHGIDDGTYPNVRGVTFGVKLGL